MTLPCLLVVLRRLATVAATPDARHTGYKLASFDKRDRNHRMNLRLAVVFSHISGAVVRLGIFNDGGHIAFRQPEKFRTKVSSIVPTDDARHTTRAVASKVEGGLVGFDIGTCTPIDVQVFIDQGTPQLPT